MDQGYSIHLEETRLRHKIFKIIFQEDSISPGLMFLFKLKTIFPIFVAETDPNSNLVKNKL